ncbi:helix-turn-helix domain-containing protein [Burkholderia alba]|uniref:helix-turn-helix domain-containing protein n=1 Tax=Burkholderia alba TaxID=2683677 RepID=UPI002B0588A8|nr:helix-turn-helix domain-containing protein [Burkholderia alba]
MQPSPKSYRFSTLDLPARERFDAWQADSSPLFDFGLPDDRSIPYNSSVAITRLGGPLLGHTIWQNPTHTVSQRIRRAPGWIRRDGADQYYFRMQRDRAFSGAAGRSHFQVGAGEICLLDMSVPFDLDVTMGDILFVVVPRDLLPTRVGNLHGHVLRRGMGGLLGDYLMSLERHLPLLTDHEISLAGSALRSMLSACFAPTPDSIAQAQGEIDDVLLNRIRTYIEQRIESPELKPDRICRDVGVSRSKLYLLFEQSGGVMRYIQHRRLHLAHERLVDPGQPRQRISDIAWKHGFVSEKHFCRIFKTEFGYRPSETRESPSRDSGETAAARVTADLSRLSFDEWVSRAV